MDGLADEYKEDAPDILESTRLVVELLKVELLRSPGRDKMPLLGDGSAGFFLSSSLSLEMPMLLGLEKSFIFDRSLGFSCAGGAGGIGWAEGAGGGAVLECSVIYGLGEGTGLRGNTVFAAVAAASRFAPAVPVA